VEEVLSFLWSEAARRALALAREEAVALDAGQRASLCWIASRISRHGVVLADEVGTGKTRIACALVRAVVEAGGRAAVVVPHGLMHQWTAEAKSVNASEPKRLTTLTEFVRDAKDEEEEWKRDAPDPDAPEWWLISHGFRTPQVREGLNPAEWRLALPTYVASWLASKRERSDGRTAYGRLHADESRAISRIAEQIAERIKGDGALRRAVGDLPRFVRNADNSRLVKELRGESNGRRLVERLLGAWLGRFDLIVIDEAHKSREELEAADADGCAHARATKQTVLGRLLENILSQPEDGRRLCLTATPMELAPDDWTDLLGRAKCGLDLTRTSKVIKRFASAESAAARAPDEKARVDELVAASRAFEKELSDHVTRRRREDDKEGIVLSPTDVGMASGTRLHRSLRSVTIPWAKVRVQGSAGWLDALLAAECMSHAARGLSRSETEGLPRSIKDAYTRLSSGHVSMDLLQDDGETSGRISLDPGLIEGPARRKIARVQYWWKKLAEARRRLAEEAGSDIDVDCEHPRIAAAVREIERWTEDTEPREKVLVFGVFRKPLRLLRDVLNVRAALRAADAGRPISHEMHDDESMLGLARRQSALLEAGGALRGALKGASAASLRTELRRAHGRYQYLRRSATEVARAEVLAWLGRPGGVSARVVTKALREMLEQHVVSFIVDDFLASGSPSEEPRRRRMEQLAQEFFRHHVDGELSEVGGELDDRDVATARAERLEAMLGDEGLHRQRQYATVLDGETRWPTRRYVQAAFNRESSSPRVLIAQSQVGREGLNLHGSCRVVIQFHAEWNPAILEQQIGRVDRKGSFWEKFATNWRRAPGGREAPRIEVRRMIFEGTYDAFQWDRVFSRQRAFDASLFGSLLPPEVLERLPEDRREEVLKAAPSFRPSNGIP